MKVMSLHGAGRPLSLARTYDVYCLNIFEQLDGDRLPLGKTNLFTVRAELTHVSLWFGVHFGDMTAFWFSRHASRLVQKAQLNRLVAIALARANLQDGARPRLDNGNRYGVAPLLINLCHADFAA